MTLEKAPTSPYESQFCTSPNECLSPKILVLGSGIGLAATEHLCRISPQLASSVVVADMGRMDVLTHLGNTEFPRGPMLRQPAAHFGGKLSLWGSSAPRPPSSFLSRFPFPAENLESRFSMVERELGVNDVSPFSDRILHSCLLAQLTNDFPELTVRSAPLAIDRFGKRWSSLHLVPDLAARGVKLLSGFRCTRLQLVGREVRTVSGQWDVTGAEYTLQPEVVVLALGVDRTLPLVRRICETELHVEAADHIRIDLHGSLPAGSFGNVGMEELGVAVLLIEGSSPSDVPFHLEVKVGPKALWPRFMPSGDNLRGRDADEAIYVQVQAIAAMHDRLPVKDLLNVGLETEIPPVMSSRDASFHGELAKLMTDVAQTIGLSNPTFSFRPLLTNHHLYGAFRVGKTVSKEFLLGGTSNLYVLPPTAYVDVDDDANPTLKSLVLSQYAMEGIAARLNTSSGVTGSTLPLELSQAH